MSNDSVRVVKSLVKPQFAGFKLLDYLSQRFNYNKQEEWQLIIDDGRIKVNEVCGRGDTVLNAADSLEYFHLNHPEPEVDFDYKVIYQCEEYLVLDKPGNLPVHPAGKFFHNTLWSRLKNDGFEPHFVNRIDRETSGLILVALNKETAGSLGKQTQNKRIHKEYLALVEGSFSDSYVAKGFLEKDSSSKIDKKFIFSADSDFEKYGKRGVHTSFSLQEKTSELSLLKCIIHTGKMHQIRATLNFLGHPLVGDKMYGVDEAYYLKFIRKELVDSDFKRLRMSRQALHAYKLKFVDPSIAKEVEFESRMPLDMQEMLRK